MMKIYKYINCYYDWLPDLNFVGLIDKPYKKYKSSLASYCIWRETQQFDCSPDSTNLTRPDQRQLELVSYSTVFSQDEGLFSHLPITFSMRRGRSRTKRIDFQLVAIAFTFSL